MVGSFSLSSSSMMPLGGNGAAVIPSQPATSRGLPSNPAQGVRRLQTSISNMPPPPPIPENFRANLSASGLLSAGQVIILAREAMRSALEDNESQAAGVNGVSTELKPGVTIDLSRKNIQELPEEVVDIIKNELERLALSHNRLTSFPARFSECTSLRYLNVRNNVIMEFPLSLCNLKSLEILDLGRNKIKILPPDIAKLASLKVLAVQKNRIEELPLCLGDMASLQVVKLDGNKIKFPPPEVFQVQATSPPNEGYLKEVEVTEVTITAHIKKFLKQKTAERAEAEKTAEGENGSDNGSEGAETPRFPLKRVVSGRFPIKVNGVDAPDLRSPNMPRAPPIPNRSHARGLSQQTTTLRKPGAMPLTIGNPNERLRSNSETLLQARAERSNERPRRLISKRANELGTLDEMQANNRFSHYRGLSHGSSMTGNVHSNMGTIMSPNSPAEPLLDRPNYVRRLSVLPEQRRESKIVDPIVESAKGILYAIFQIHPMIQLFTRLTNDGTAKRSSLEIVFFNTNMHVQELEQEIMKHESEDYDNYAPRENENVQRAVLTLINAYGHICSILLNNMDTIVRNGDPRYIRTLMLCLYNSITELRVTANETLMGMPGLNAPAPTARRLGPGGTIKPHSRDSSATPTVDRPSLGGRPRNGNFSHNPSNLRVATDVAMPYINGTGRTATITSATPRSGESFASSDGGRYGGDVSSEERYFEKIFLSLSKSSEELIRTLPTFNVQFNNCLRDAKAKRAPEHIIQHWVALINRCGHSIRQTEMLKGRLSTIKLREPGIRTDPTFWALCKSFADAWAEFGKKLMSAINDIALPMDIRQRLRPIQLSVKETTQLIVASPWVHIFHHAGQGQDGANYYSAGHYSSNSNVSQPQMPVTPQSAALGPAVQATIPSTPQSASFAGAFSGNVFERADALLSLGGMSMSRSGTMDSRTHSSFNSISSITSTQDERQGPGSTLSPNNESGPTTYRRNGGGRSGY